jgi:hypothetical protein
MRRFVAGADRGQHCLPNVACGDHGDQIETADTAVGRIEVKKPLPFAIRLFRDKTTADVFGKLARAIDAQIWFLRSPSR